MFDEARARPYLAPGEYFVVVKPSPVGNWNPAGHSFQVEQQTTLTYAVPTYLTCFEQDDTIGDDDILLESTSDGLTIGPRYIGEFDSEDNPRPLDQFGPYKYDAALYLTLWEDDGGLDGADDNFGFRWNNPMDPAVPGSIRYIIKWEGGHHYDMTVHFSHEPPRK
jgi:hypothetical protein